MRADRPAAPRSPAVCREEGKGRGKLKFEKSESKKRREGSSEFKTRIRSADAGH